VAPVPVATPAPAPTPAASVAQASPPVPPAEQPRSVVPPTQPSRSGGASDPNAKHDEANAAPVDENSGEHGELGLSGSFFAQGEADADHAAQPHPEHDDLDEPVRRRPRTPEHEARRAGLIKAVVGVLVGISIVVTITFFLRRRLTVVPPP